MSQEKEIKGFLVSKTDPKGKITYCNQAFIEVSGFGESELLGKPHSIVRHPDMPRTIFKFLWEEVSNKREINAFVKNLSKDGGYYWVFANVTPSVDITNKIIGYYSVRRRASKAGVEALSTIYKKCLELESSQGMQAAQDYITEILKSHKQTWNELMISLQAQGEIGGYR